MWPFVDPVTKQKVKFGTDIVADGDIDKEWLMKECGGDLDVGLSRVEQADEKITYDHDTYWPALVKACQERREQDAIRWRALGEPKVGREERDFKRSSTGEGVKSSPAPEEKAKEEKVGHQGVALAQT